MSLSVEEAKSLTQSYNNKNKRPVPPPPQPQPQRRAPLMDEEEPVSISNLRKSNPNLQPLTTDEIKNLKRNGRHSIQAPPTVPPTTSMESLTRQHSYGSSREHKSVFRASSFLRSGERIHRRESSSTEQSFWKYHILEFGNGLYLTTNPDSKHMYCRNAPGYYIEILYPTLKSGREDTSGRRGFRLVFKNQIDGDVFLTVTKTGDEYEIDLLRRYFLGKDGQLDLLETDVTSYHQQSKAVEIQELKGKFIEPQLKLERKEISDFNKRKWYLGSIPQYKSATKLKNKRYLFFHEPKGEILACFRPQEVRAKKKLIKKFNRSLNSGSNSFYYEENSSENSVSNDTVYYSPGDGVYQQDPPDDSPNDAKLGWITIYDDYNVLKVPGMWEMALSFTLAMGLAQILEENQNVNKFN